MKNVFILANVGIHLNLHSEQAHPFTTTPTMPHLLLRPNPGGRWWIFFLVFLSTEIPCFRNKPGGFSMDIKSIQGYPAWFFSPLKTDSISLEFFNFSSFFSFLFYDSIFYDSRYIALKRKRNGIPKGAVANVLDCDSVINQFEFHLRYYGLFQTTSLGKGMNLVIPVSNRLNCTTAVILEGQLKC